MATSIQTLIDLGYNKSSAARIDTIAISPELVARVGQCLREVFQVLSREQPALLGTSAQVAFNGSGWSRPTDCLRVIRVVADVGTIASPVITAGTEIAVVPYDDRTFCFNRPSVTELGQAFIPAGQSLDPSAGTLTLVYARAPIIPTTVDDTLDPLIPSFYDDIFQCDIAAYLAYKDKRKEDEDLFLSMKSALLGQMIDWATQQTYSVQSRYQMVSPPPVVNTNAGRAQPTKGQG